MGRELGKGITTAVKSVGDRLQSTVANIGKELGKQERKAEQPAE